MHINIPFKDDEEFGRLHAAIRLLLPLLPALAASSPIMDGRGTGLHDNRLDVYRTNCARIPSLTGQVIPEPFFQISNYKSQILDRLYRDISPYDPDGILQNEWVNARGAIARFDRNTIEIRVLDVQECPAADVAIAALVLATLDALMDELWCPLDSQQAWPVMPLHDLLIQTIRNGGAAVIDNRDYLTCFGRRKRTATAFELWQDIANEVLPEVVQRVTTSPPNPTITLIEKGSLAGRIVQRLGDSISQRNLHSTFALLRDNLAYGEMFL
jgi:gamma-glutamyl:cysteine ligase YbdK (ATP-grasp superfamily)